MVNLIFSMIWKKMKRKKKPDINTTKDHHVIRLKRFNNMPVVVSVTDDAEIFFEFETIGLTESEINDIKEELNLIINEFIKEIENGN